MSKSGRTLRGAIPLRRVVLLTRSLAGLDLILVIAGGKRLRLRAHAPDEFMQWFEAIQQVRQEELRHRRR